MTTVSKESDCVKMEVKQNKGVITRKLRGDLYVVTEKNSHLL